MRLQRTRPLNRFKNITKVNGWWPLILERRYDLHNQVLTLNPSLMRVEHTLYCRTHLARRVMNGRNIYVNYVRRCAKFCKFKVKTWYKWRSFLRSNSNSDFHSDFQIWPLKLGRKSVGVSSGIFVPAGGGWRKLVWTSSKNMCCREMTLNDIYFLSSSSSSSSSSNLYTQ